MRSAGTIELLRDLLAFGLLALIAFRARWHSGFSTDGLEIGEALIGDYKKCGMTRRQYRTRLARLVEWGLITVRPTHKGTIAKLTSNALFDINVAPSPNDHQLSHEPATNRPSRRPTDLPLKNTREIICLLIFRLRTTSFCPSREPRTRIRGYLVGKMSLQSGVFLLAVAVS